MSSNQNQATETSKTEQSIATRTNITDLNAFVNNAEHSADARTSGRAIMIVIAIIALVFINVGIFYTTRITKQSNDVAIPTAAQSNSTKLDTSTIQKLQNRTAVDVESQLTPYGSGRADPFVNP